MEEVQMLKKQIEDNKRKIKALEKKEKQNKIQKRELEKFKKWRNEVLDSPYLKYHNYLEDRDGFCGDWVYYLTGWFGLDVEELEKAKQFVSYINNDEEEIKGFEEAIKYVKEVEEE